MARLRLRQSSEPAHQYDKRDNRFENLERKQNSTHTREHNVTDRPSKAMIRLTCPSCEQQFDKSLRQYKAQKNYRGQTDFYCSRSCSSAAFGGGRPKHAPLA